MLVGADDEDYVCLDMPCIIKAIPNDRKKRIVEVEASNEAVDLQGDVMLQSALMAAAPEFVEYGHFDIDHLSEYGARMGVKNPTSYIIGKPISVHDLGGGRTAVRGEIRQPLDGEPNPAKNKYDEFWDSLQSDPPMQWRASVYGFSLPGGVTNCQSGTCQKGATRLMITKFKWTSLAFTRRPVNDSIVGAARIIKGQAMLEHMAALAKAEGVGGGVGMFKTSIEHLLPVAALAKAGGMGKAGVQDGMFNTSIEHLLPDSTNSKPAAPEPVAPRTMSDAWDARVCQSCLCHQTPMTLLYRTHFRKCLGLPDGEAELLANAVMHHHRRHAGAR